MICGWIEVEESQEEPIAQHSGGSKVPRNRIDDVSNHVRETFLLDPIKIVEVIQLKIAAFVQTVCVEKQGANAKNGNETQEIRTPANTAHLCNRTRCFQCFSFEVLCGGNWIRSSYGIIARMQAPKREAPFPGLGKRQAIFYAENRTSFRSGEIRILDSSGGLERTIPFSEA